MTANVYQRLGVPTVINAVGYATRVGGSLPSEAVLAAMTEANRACIEVDDLLAAASRAIGEHIGAEAGIVTCGAAAGLTLAAAACLAGDDVEVMDRLPDTTGLARREIIYPQLGPFDYEHPLRVAGATLVSVDYAMSDALKRIEAAINEHTAAIGFCWLSVEESPAIDQLADLAHAHGLPLIVDGAMSLPPVENLTRFIALGADLVTYSGGKHLRGPQASGILCGRADLVRSAWLQMVDMDVRPGSWSLRPWVERGWIARPPRHGIGRSMKVGKETVAGLLTALEQYHQRDHEAEYEQWHAIVRKVAAGLADVDGLCATVRDVAPNGQRYPVVELTVGDPSGGEAIDAHALQRRLRAGTPPVILAEDVAQARRAYVCPLCLNADDAGELVRCIRAAMADLAQDTGAPR